MSSARLSSMQAPAVATLPQSSAAKRLAESFARNLWDSGTRIAYGVPGGGNNLELVEACEAAGSVSC